MARLRRGNNGPRVVGFDFSGMPAPAAEPVAEPVPEAAAPPYEPPYEPPYAPPPFAEPFAEPVAERVPEPAYAAPVATPASVPVSAIPSYAEPAYSTPYSPPAYAAPAEAPPGYLPPVTAATPQAPADGQPFQPFQPGAPGVEVPPFRPDGLASRPSYRRGYFPGRGLAMGVAVVVFVGGGGYRTYQRYFGKPYSMPNRIAEYLKMENTVSDQIENEIARERFGEIGRPVFGVYAMNHVPAFVVLAGDSKDTSGKQIYDDFRSVASTNNTAVSEPAVIGGNACGTFSNGEYYGTICYWGTKNHSDGGVVFLGVYDLENAARITSLAKKGVEG